MNKPKVIDCKERLNPIRVLVEILNNDLNTGAANDFLDFAAYAHPLRIDLVFTGPLSQEMSIRAQRLHVRTIFSQNRTFSRGTIPFFAIDAIRWMLRLLKNKIDVVHLDHAGWGTSLAYAAYKLDIPVVMRAGGRYHSKNPANKWTDAYAANCAAHASLLLNSPLASKVFVLGSFFDVARLNPPFQQVKDIPSKEQGQIRFLYMGQLVPRKGIDTLIKAFAGLTKPADLLLVGGDWDDEGYPSHIKALAQDLDLGQNVHFENHRTDVGALLSNCDVFVLPSLEDARPRVIIEAMYLGKPIIATRVGGIPTLVEDETTGILVPPNDPIGLKNALDRLAGNQELRNLLGSNASARACNEFNPSATAQNYAHMYRKLCGAKRKTKLKPRF